MGTPGADGIGVDKPITEEADTVTATIAGEETPLPELSDEPVEIFIDTIQNYAAIAAANPAESEKMMGALQREIREAFGIDENNLESINPEIESRIEALAQAVQSNAVSEIENAANHLFEGNIASQEQLLQLVGMNDGNFAGISVGGRNPWRDAAAQARRNNERAGNVAAINIAVAQAAAIDAGNQAAADYIAANRERIVYNGQQARETAIANGAETPEEIAVAVAEDEAVTEDREAIAQSVENSDPADVLTPEQEARIAAEQQADLFIEEGTLDASVRQAFIEASVARDMANLRNNDFLAGFVADTANTFAGATRSTYMTDPQDASGVTEELAETVSAPERSFEEILVDFDESITAATNYAQLANTIADQIDANIEAGAYPPDDLSSMMEESTALRDEAQKQLDIANTQREVAIGMNNFVNNDIPSLVGDLEQLDVADLQMIAQQIPPSLVVDSLRLKDLQAENEGQIYDNPLEDFFASITEGLSDAEKAAFEQAMRDTEFDPTAIPIDISRGLVDHLAELETQRQEYIQGLEGPDRGLFQSAVNQTEREIAQTEQALDLMGEQLHLQIAAVEAEIARISESMYNEDGLAMNMHDGSQFIASPQDQINYQMHILGNLHAAMAEIPEDSQPEGYMTPEEQRAAANAAPEPEWDRNRYSYLEDDARALVEEIISSPEPITELQLQAMIADHQLLQGYGENSDLMVRAVLEDLSPNYVFSDGPTPAIYVAQIVHDEIHSNTQIDSISKEDIMNMLSEYGLEGEDLMASTEQIVADLQAEIGLDFVTGLNYPDPVEVGGLQGDPQPTAEETDPIETVENTTPQGDAPAHEENQYAQTYTGPGTAM